MSDSSFAYSSARIRCLENKLLSGPVYEQMADASSTVMRELQKEIIMQCFPMS